MFNFQMAKISFFIKSIPFKLQPFQWIRFPLIFLRQYGYEPQDKVCYICCSFIMHCLLTYFLCYSYLRLMEISRKLIQYYKCRYAELYFFDYFHTKVLVFLDTQKRIASFILRYLLSTRSCENILHA